MKPPVTKQVLIKRATLLSETDIIFESYSTKTQVARRLPRARKLSIVRYWVDYFNQHHGNLITFKDIIDIQNLILERYP